ncbi:DUF4407 domain-containing protein [Polynucleobacter sp. es-EL-1]|uniref:DUF4407 domain-containing protein n=1 Tax=Polynucleobacter sp. es-EL-1 TaxID=1855652 RepID=UPI001BFED1C1|nr:DUF4407 domain-containing protein [Polynucleobacter sp. es-EL-1]QWE09854.1 DUF4407 domain-containing protein [Polynucleobacter sp. es-EL-1]
MSTIRQKLVFLTGHRIDADASAQEIGSLSKIGAAIAFASFLAALQFGIAGWFLAMDLNILLQISMAVTFASIGAAIVLVLDRNFIYLADTRYETDKKLTYVYLGIRIFLITVIGSLSSQFTMPLFLKSELAIHAQDMKDGRFAEAKERYQEKYELADKTVGLTTLEAKEATLKKELTTLTPELVRQRGRVGQCFADYNKKIKMTFAPDLDEHDIVSLYAKDKQECQRIDGIYRQSYRNYVEPREAELARMGTAITQAQGNIDTAKNEIAKELEKASKVNEANINVASADVLSSLVRNNPGALMKYALLTLLQLCLELMPILLKLQAGQSPLGHRMAIFAYENKTRALTQVNQSAAKRIDAEAQIELAKHEHALVEKEQFATRQEYDSRAVKQKLMQDLENEHLRQELEELKRQSSAYLRAQHQFTQAFSQASGQFVNRVVMPTVTTVTKPFASKSAEGATSADSNQAANESAKVFDFGGVHGLGVKAAS